ncbi:MAG: LptE family protein [Bacteroidota bacterium]|nr:LptE family protein [Bacteroidota bacterium]
MVLKNNDILPGRSCKIILALAVVLLSVLNSCKVSYSFTGASTTGLRTISIQYFQNRASLVQPGLSQSLTDALIDKCKAQTNLNIVNGIGDANFEGEITDYNTKPLTVSAEAVAAMNRFTITVKVKFTNAADPDLSFEQLFSRYEDYDSSKNLSDVEQDLSQKIIEMIVEDIFNRAFVNW